MFAVRMTLTRNSSESCPVEAHEALVGGGSWCGTSGVRPTPASRLRGDRVDDSPHRGHFRSRKPAPPGVFLNQRLVLGQVDAEGLVSRNIGMFPLNVLLFGLHCGKHTIGLLGSFAQRLAFGRTDARNLAFNDVSGHDISLVAHGQVAKADVSVIGSNAVPSGFVYCLTSLVCVSVTVNVNSMLVVAAAKTQKRSLRVTADNLFRGPRPAEDAGTGDVSSRHGGRPGARSQRNRGVRRTVSSAGTRGLADLCVSS